MYDVIDFLTYPFLFCSKWWWSLKVRLMDVVWSLVDGEGRKRRVAIRKIKKVIKFVKK